MTEQEQYEQKKNEMIARFELLIETTDDENLKNYYQVIKDSLPGLELDKGVEDD